MSIATAIFGVVSVPGAVTTGSGELLLSLIHWIIDSMNQST
jgi:hypothetical protein